MTNQEKILQDAKTHLGRHLTLNPAVPAELGCAEAVSWILRDVGYAIHNGGEAGTAGLNTWIKNSEQFMKTTSPQAGDIIGSITGTSSKNDPHGHIGIVLENGVIGSNDSDTGLFITKYTLTTWDNYFHKTLGFPTVYWRAI